VGREYARAVRGLTGRGTGDGNGLRLGKGGQWREGELSAGCETDGLQLTAMESSKVVVGIPKNPEAVNVEKIGPPKGH
jgi:hypothetical protein